MTDPRQYARVEYSGFEFELYQCSETGKYIAVIIRTPEGHEVRRGEQWVRPTLAKLRRAISSWSKMISQSPTPAGGGPVRISRQSDAGRSTC